MAFRSPLATFVSLLFIGTTVAEAASIRRSYDPSNLDRETIEVDLVTPCANRDTCSIEIANGQFVRVTGAADAGILFDGLNKPDGVVADVGRDQMKLPGHVCVDAAPYIIDSFAWKSNNKTVAPADYDSTTNTFTSYTDVTRQKGIIQMGNTSRVCMKHPKAPFAFLWVKLTSPATATPKGNISFSSNMKRASTPLLASVTQALGEARTLADRDSLTEVICTDRDNDCTPEQNARIKATIQKLGPLISTLEAAKNTLDPTFRANHSLVSVAHPRVRWALKAAQGAYRFAEPFLSPLLQVEPKISKKDKMNPGVTVLAASLSFQRNLRWLQADLESFQIYGEDSDANSATALMAQMLIERLATVRPALTNPETLAPLAQGDAPDFNELLDALQSRLVAVKQSAQAQGDSGADVAKAVNDFATIWNTDLAADMTKMGLRIQEIGREMRLFKDLLLTGLQGLPAANGIKFADPTARKS